MNDMNSKVGLFLKNDPPPVEWVNRHSKCPVLLLCEHAGQAIPARLEGLELPEGAIDLHIGWDIGAERLARSISERLSAPLILQRYSRLVIDCNRPPGVKGSIPEVSDHVIIPGNQGLDLEARRQREMLIFEPLDTAISEGFEAAPRVAAFSIHSFTRQMQQGDRRKCDAGFLCRRDMNTAQHFVDSLGRMRPDLILAINEPYRIEDEGDWFIPKHAEPRGVRHCLIEVCNDQLESDTAVAHWADLLTSSISEMLEA